MMIEFACHGCGQKMRAADKSAGKSAACPKCGLKLIVPDNDPLAGLDEFMAAQQSGMVSSVSDERSDKWHLGLAAVMSFFVPGLGQIYKRQIGRGLTIMGSMLLLSVIAAVLIIVALGAAPLVGFDSWPLLLLVLAFGAIVAAAIVWYWQLSDAANSNC